MKKRQVACYVFVIAIAAAGFLLNSDGESEDAYYWDTDETTYRQVGEVDNASYGSVKRFRIRIEIPVGRSDDNIKATLELAASELATKLNANAAIVEAYHPGSPLDGVSAIGRAEIAPFGDWGKAGEDGPMRTTVELLAQ